MNVTSVTVDFRYLKLDLIPIIEGGKVIRRLNVFCSKA